MKIVYTEAEYVALLDRFKKGDEKKYRGVNTLYGIPVEVEDGITGLPAAALPSAQRLYRATG